MSCKPQRMNSRKGRAMQNNFEILSPAGNFEILKSAVLNGADAVYIGGKSFSARKNAANFSDDEIAEGVRFAHLYGAKVYAAVNTLIRDSELKSAFEFIKYLYEVGVDALIIQDLAIVKTVKKHFPDFPIHASTQMTVHNIAGVRAAEKLGFSRVVLSRELSFEEIENISKNTDAELEVFVHGALCMSYSGQCLLSSFIGSRSGNRGACAQPCRLPYSLFDNGGKCIVKDKYLLSLKDLCLVDEIETLKKCGVASLKIEGRMKNEDYVSVVTHTYDKYRNGSKVSDKDMAILKNVFSRSGFTKGYLIRYTGREMLNYSKNNDDVYSLVSDDVKILSESLKKNTSKKVKFSSCVSLKAGQPLKASFVSGEATVSLSGVSVAQAAIKTPLDFDRVKQQFSKTGNTPFELDSFTADIGDGLCVPIKDINDLRRRGLDELSNILSYSSRKSCAEYEALQYEKFTCDKVLKHAQVMNLQQAHSALNLGFDKIIIPYFLYLKEKDFFDGIDKKIAVVLPSITRDGVMDFKKITGFEIYASNISQIFGFDGCDICANYTLNVFNSLSLEMMKELGIKRVCLSPELNLKQIDAMGDFAEKEIIVYGKIPLMTVQNCVVKSAFGKCFCKDDKYYLKDRKGAEFPLYTDKTSCTNTIFNSAPIYMADKLDEIPLHGIRCERFVFTDETPNEMADIYDKYQRHLPHSGDFTRGHYYRGV